MSKSRKPTIEEAREMSKEELSRSYGISEKLAVDFKTALEPEYFSTLTNSDLTFKEMAEKLGVSYLTIRHYRYTLTKVGLGGKRKRKSTIEAPQKILSFLKNKPSLYDDIFKNTEASPATLYRLIGKDKVRSVNMKLFGRGRRHTFHSDQLIDGLTARSIAYLPGEERLLGGKVTEHLPKELTLGMRKSLTYRLKSILPKEAFEVVYEYMREHAAR